VQRQGVEAGLGRRSEGQQPDAVLGRRAGPVGEATAAMAISKSLYGASWARASTRV
jgi:hypothetical protein